MSEFRNSKEGVLISTPLDSDKIVSVKTRTCCHCNRVFLSVPGSGKKRGYCLRCMDSTCGNPACDACVPIEQRLENWEAGRPEDFRAVNVSLSGQTPRG